MGKFRIMRAVFAVCAIGMQSIVFLDAFDEDHRSSPDLLDRYALVTSLVNMDYSGSTTIRCPRRVKDTDYVWHPKPISYEQAHLRTYVVEDEHFLSVPLSDVVVSEKPINFVSVALDESQSKLSIAVASPEVFVITKSRLVFICGPRDLILSDTLQQQLSRLNGLSLSGEFPWTAGTALTQEIKKLGRGLRMFSLVTGQSHLPLQGCGSRPSPLFAPDNEVIVDPITGTRSCVADPMSQSSIGFLCEGRIEPMECMRFLLDRNGRVVTVTNPHLYWNIANNRPWVVAKYFDKLALPPINGECRCIDRETGDVKAKLEIRSKTEYFCDIASKVFRDRYHPIRGPWCSAVLHPGSTLTIKLPAKIVNSASINEPSDKEHDDDLSVVPFSQLPSIYEYETEFLPKDLMTLRQQSVPYDANMHNEKLFSKALVGDALELDVSHMAQGEVKLKYRVDRPLTLRSGLNSFQYHWTLISRNENVPDKIRAIVQVSFAFTHNYRTIGCDVGLQSLFDPEMSKEHCTVRSMGNGIGDIYECLYQNSGHSSHVGIRCKPDEELFPNNCAPAGYDLSSNQIMPFPPFVRNATLYPILGFQRFDIDFRDKGSLSYACMCIDQRGYEKSKLIVESNTHDTCRYVVNREEPSNTWHPYRLLPWSELELGEWHRSPVSIVLNNIYKKFVKLHVGTRFSMTCARGSDDSNPANNANITPTWLPGRSIEYHYAVIHTSHGRELIRRPHRDAIGGTLDGFRVISGYFYTESYIHLVMESRKGAILISKDPDNTEYVPITFVCGKTPRISELSIVPGNTSAAHIPYAIGLLAPYTWNVVEVAVETTDPYMQGCGVTYASDELFKPDTPQLYDANGLSQFGCKIYLQAAKEAAFYCPAPYVLDPPNCFSQVYVDGAVKDINDISESLVTSHSNHFVILRLYSKFLGPEETIRQTPPLECRCVTTKGAILSTIHIENYYAK
ncbi:hypothetical protein, conserved [Babesia ovata]|uniref:6-Cys domain-containing protein n=1 Tax=Babesia ovata TaxID=189622 RepID=A0A2H6K9Z3_9APIC|nr:uncharacterized protein BOVATA_012620 [Babesia ovata]GBE59769.1 hypothetical protein, conserved [Babesia ovata]